MRITINTSKGLWVKTLESLGLMEAASEQPAERVPEPPEPFVQPVPEAAGGLIFPDAETGFPFRELSESSEIADTERLVEEITISSQKESEPEEPAEELSSDFGEVERNEIPEAALPRRNGRETEQTPPASAPSRATTQIPSPGSKASVSATASPAAGSPLFKGSILKGKKLHLIGFNFADVKALRAEFERHGAQVLLPEAMADLQGETSAEKGNGAEPGNPPESLWVALRDSDLVLMNTPAEWELMEPIRPGFLSQYAKPAILTGSKNLLLRVAQLEQAGRRDYVAAPATLEDLVWRVSLMLGRPAPSRAEVPAVRPQRAKPEILIVDEDASARSLITTMLERYGMVCIQAEQGREALDLIRTNPPDAVVAEVSLSGIDGFQLLASVKQDPALEHVRFLLLTGRISEASKLQGFALGADDYLGKPFSPMELAARLRRLLKSRS